MNQQDGLHYNPVQEIPGGAICEYCEHPMLAVDSCVLSTFIIAEEIYRRIAYANLNVSLDRQAGHRCRDCNVLVGGIHHHGCSQEMCPNCGDQAAFCGCIEGLMMYPEGWDFKKDVMSGTGQYPWGPGQAPE